jgi:hypothetical protein
MALTSTLGFVIELVLVLTLLAYLTLAFLGLGYDIRKWDWKHIDTWKDKLKLPWKNTEEEEKDTTEEDPDEGNDDPDGNEDSDPDEECEETEWTECSVECGGGTRTRQLSDCNLQMQNCNTEACVTPVDCTVSVSYGDWSDCDLATDTRSRTKPILVDAANGGTPCPSEADRTETESCCKVADWSAWRCNEATGILERERSILQGTYDFCPPDLVVREEGGVCNVDCVMSDWSDWSECKHPLSGNVVDCGPARREATRTVITPAQGQGAGCGPTWKDESCNLQDCVVNQECVLGPWTPSSDCSQPCGGAGQREETRAVVQEASGTGVPCVGPDHPSRKRVSSCNDHLCTERMDRGFRVKPLRTFSIDSARFNEFAQWTQPPESLKGDDDCADICNVAQCDLFHEVDGYCTFYFLAPGHQGHEIGAVEGELWVNENTYTSIQAPAVLTHLAICSPTQAVSIPNGTTLYNKDRSKKLRVIPDGNVEVRSTADSTLWFRAIDLPTLADDPLRYKGASLVLAPTGRLSIIHPTHGEVHVIYEGGTSNSSAPHALFLETSRMVVREISDNRMGHVKWEAYYTWMSDACEFGGVTDLETPDGHCPVCVDSNDWNAMQPWIQKMLQFSDRTFDDVPDSLKKYFRTKRQIWNDKPGETCNLPAKELSVQCFAKDRYRECGDPNAALWYSLQKNAECPFNVPVYNLGYQYSTTRDGCASDCDDRPDCAGFKMNNDYTGNVGSCTLVNQACLDRTTQHNVPPHYEGGINLYVKQDPPVQADAVARDAWFVQPPPPSTEFVGCYPYTITYDAEYLKRPFDDSEMATGPNEQHGLRYQDMWDGHFITNCQTDALDGGFQYFGVTNARENCWLGHEFNPTTAMDASYCENDGGMMMGHRDPRTPGMAVYKSTPFHDTSHVVFRDDTYTRRVRPDIQDTLDPPVVDVCIADPCNHANQCAPGNECWYVQQNSCPQTHISYWCLPPGGGE